jgi:imidazole glycerol-phosphate synthase subunit HisH
MIAVIDYDIGNLGAVANMLRRLGEQCEITADARVVRDASRIVLPGNGAFDSCMRALRSTGLMGVLERRVLEDRVPLLGICVGAQMLGCGSDEGSEPGLAWIDFRVRRLPDQPGLPVPHMGWQPVSVIDPSHPLTGGLEPDSRFYFVHSYYMDAPSADNLLLRSHYGIPFAAGVVRSNIAGVQFHPEKSHRFGKQLLSNFARWSL